MPTDLLTKNGEPLYQRVTEQLRAEMARGVLQPGDRLPTFAQWRERHGVHKNTVERAHLLLEQEGLILREHGRGTFVAPLRAEKPKRAQKKVRGELIGFCGFLQSHSASSFWMRVLDGIHAGMQSEAASRKIAGREALQLLLLGPESEDLPDRLAGALFNGMMLNAPPRWHDEKWPCVSIIIPNRTVEVSSVVADNYAGAREATQHLIDLGHKKIAYLPARKPNVIVPQRMAGYRHALQGAKIKFRPQWVRPASSESPLTHLHNIGRDEMRAWLKSDWKKLGCTAILAHNDEVAIGIIEALNEAGLSVPNDVSVVGFDGIEASEYSRPRLTTVEVPLREIGQTAMQLLTHHIENGVDEWEHIVLPTKLCVRESTAPPKRQ